MLKALYDKHGIRLDEPEAWVGLFYHQDPKRVAEMRIKLWQKVAERAIEGQKVLMKASGSKLVKKDDVAALIRSQYTQAENKRLKKELKEL